MKDVTVTLSAKASRIVLAIILLLLTASIAFAYREISNMRRDLYGVRGDYYGYAYDSEFADQGSSSQIEYSLIGQSVENMRVLDQEASYAKIDYEPVYTEEMVRVLELKIKNNQDYLFTYYDTLAAVGQDGVLQRSIQVHDDDNKNTWYTDNYGMLELIPGGEATIYLYLIDDGTEITSLYNTEYSQEVKLQ